MKANQRYTNGDDAVSPVIAVILMVAITVVLAATVYIWVTSFSSQQNQPVSASVDVQALDRDGNSRTDTIRLILTNAPSAPFANSTLSYSINGTTYDGSTKLLTVWMTQPSGAAGVPDGTGTSSTFSWSNAGALYLDCKAGGPNLLVVSIRGNVVKSGTYSCDE